MNFGDAINAMKSGLRVSRKGWNGQGQFVEIGSKFSYVSTSTNTTVNVYHEDIGGQAFVFHGTRGVQVGWLASQADMLADDWFVVK